MRITQGEAIRPSRVLAWEISARCLGVFVLLAAIHCVWGTAVFGAEPCEPLKTPKLLVTLPDICPTPDGLALAPDGTVILACPNFADQTRPGVLMKIDRENRAKLWFKVPPLAETGVACPMGIEFGPAGELYICDNQGWKKPNNKGRLLRLDVKDGRPGKVTVVAHGMSHPNGVRVRDGQIYVTQSMLVKNGDEPLISGIYRFKPGDEGIKVNNDLSDKNLLVTFKTLHPQCQYGVDGLVFDGKGNLFVGNFGDATIHKVTFDAQGKVASNTIFAKDPCMKSTDGICIDARGNIYVADFSGNAVCVVSPEGKVRVLAKSGDTDGAKGELDQPGDPLVRGNQLIVSNFDLVTGPDKVNTKHDLPYTLSVIELDK